MHFKTSSSDYQRISLVLILRDAVKIVKKSVDFFFFFWGGGLFSTLYVKLVGNDLHRHYFLYSTTFMGYGGSIPKMENSTLFSPNFNGVPKLQYAGNQFHFFSITEIGVNVCLGSWPWKSFQQLKPTLEWSTAGLPLKIGPPSSIFIISDELSIRWDFFRLSPGLKLNNAGLWKENSYQSIL